MKPLINNLSVLSGRVKGFAYSDLNRCGDKSLADVNADIVYYIFFAVFSALIILRAAKHIDHKAPFEIYTEIRSTFPS